MKTETKQQPKPQQDAKLTKEQKEAQLLKQQSEIRDAKPAKEGEKRR
ncbi:hypothetical protein L1F30_11195 [Simiduia sp. 21SJ11W-1]|nr:hypothetical protein [Simiduia sp. 21SJ11W-1]UTA46728.1 hypothetical protein L1F30_11195 [Simiduia sp. 21SJ11W-1]